MKLNDKTVSVDLSQEDTFKFSAETNAKIQIRVLSLDGKLFANRPVTIDVIDSYNKEVLT